MFQKCLKHKTDLFRNECLDLYPSHLCWLVVVWVEPINIAGFVHAVAVFQGIELQPNRTLKSPANGTASLPQSVAGHGGSWVLCYGCQRLCLVRIRPKMGNNIKRYQTAMIYCLLRQMMIERYIVKFARCASLFSAMLPIPSWDDL